MLGSTIVGMWLSGYGALETFCPFPRIQTLFLVKSLRILVSPGRNEWCTGSTPSSEHAISHIFIRFGGYTFLLIRLTSLNQTILYTYNE